MKNPYTEFHENATNGLVADSSTDGRAEELTSSPYKGFLLLSKESLIQRTMTLYVLYMYQYACTSLKLASSLHHPIVQRQPKLMFEPPDGRTLCHNCITQHNCAVKTPLFQYLVGGPKEELGAQFEVYRCIAVGFTAQSCFTAVKNQPVKVPVERYSFPSPQPSSGPG